MKKTLIIALIALVSFATVSCEKPEEIWEDNANPEVFFPRYGYTNQTIWAVTSGSYETYLGIYCGGLRPANQKSNIDVTVAVDPALVDAYNADITSKYQGELEVLPTNCYTIASSTVTIPAGEVDAKLPIKFDVAAVKAAMTDAAKRYVIPFKLTNTSMYSLSADAAFTQTFMQVGIGEPSFYFFCNNYGVSLESTKLIYGTTGNVYKYDVMGNGVPDGEYKVSFKLDKDALEKMYPGVEMVPEDAVILDTESTYKDITNHAYLQFELVPEKLAFFKTYYLPVTIVPAEYGTDAERGTFFMTIEMKNEFEKSYKSTLMVETPATNRTATYSDKKNVTTYDSDIVELNIAKNNTIAGAKVSQTSATTYNNRYIRVKVIPTDDKSHYNIEYIPVTDKAKKNNTPDEFKAVEGKDNYYDWNEEKFVMNYCWRHIEKKDTSWIYVTEVLQAN